MFAHWNMAEAYLGDGGAKQKFNCLRGQVNLKKKLLGHSCLILYSLSQRLTTPPQPSGINLPSGVQHQTAKRIHRHVVTADGYVQHEL